MSWNTILRSTDKPTQPLHNESRAAAVLCLCVMILILMKQKNTLIQKRLDTASALEIFSNGAQKLREAGQWLLIILQFQIIAECKTIRPDAVSAVLLLNHISAGKHIRVQISVSAKGSSGREVAHTRSPL